MEWLNYHHLLYFWTVAREGSIAKACLQLRLAQPTISGQLRMLEQSLGEKLFTKSGRGLALTEVGQLVFDYAEQIFGIGRELQQAVAGRTLANPQRRLVVGLSDMVSKLVAYRILQPVLAMPKPARLICHEGDTSHLLAALSEHRLDVVLTDSPAAPLPGRRVYNHLLGSCPLTLFGSPALAARYRKRFPAGLGKAPFLMPNVGSPLRQSIDHWFDAVGIEPFIVGEFQDGALMKTFGSAGAGLFIAPSAIETDVVAAYGVRIVGRITSLRQSFFAISVERRLKHPAVLALCEAARDSLFAVE